MDKTKTFFLFIKSNETLIHKNVRTIFNEYARVTKVYLSDTENKVYFETLEDAKKVYLSFTENPSLNELGLIVSWPEKLKQYKPPIDGGHSGNSSSDLCSERSNTILSMNNSINNQSYVDIFKKPICVLEGTDGGLYVPLEEVQERGLLIIPEKDYPKKIFTYNDIIDQFEMYMRRKAMDFLIEHQVDIDEGVMAQSINQKKSLVFQSKDVQEDETIPTKTSPPHNKFATSSPGKITPPKCNLNHSCIEFTKLELNEIQEVYVTHIVDDTFAYVTLAHNDVEDFLAEVNDYALESSKVTQPKQGSVYAALYEGQWYRAQILNVETLYLSYIDFGNRGYGKISELRELSEELTMKPALAVNIKVYENNSTKNLTEDEAIYLKPIKATPVGYVGVFKKSKEEFNENNMNINKPKTDRNEHKPDHSNENYRKLSNTSSTSVSGSNDKMSKIRSSIMSHNVVGDAPNLQPLRNNLKRPYRDMSPPRSTTLNKQTNQINSSELRVTHDRNMSKPFRKPNSESKSFDVSEEISTQLNSSRQRYSFRDDVANKSSPRSTTLNEQTNQINSSELRVTHDRNMSKPFRRPNSEPKSFDVSEEISTQLNSSKQRNSFRDDVANKSSPRSTTLNEQTNQINSSELRVTHERNMSKPFRKPNSELKSFDVSKEISTQLNSSRQRNSFRDDIANKSSKTWGEKPTPRLEHDVRPCVIDEISKGEFYATEFIDESSCLAYVISENFSDQFILLSTITVDKSGLPLKNPKIGDMVLVEHVDDGEKNWARAIISDISNNTTLPYTCALIDFGETIMTDDVYAIPDNVKNVLDFSFMCYTDKNTISKIKQADTLEYVINESGKCTVIDNTNKYELEVKKWNPIAKKERGNRPSLSHSFNVKLQKAYKCVPPSFNINNGDLVVIIKECEEFLYVKTKQCHESLLEINKEISAVKGEVLNAPEINQLVLAPRKSGSSLFRGIIMKITGTEASVNFIDLGITETDVPLNLLQNINDKLCLMHCAVIKTPNLVGYKGKTFGPNSFQYLQDCIEKRIKFKVCFCGNDVIDLIHNKDGSSLCKTLTDLDTPIITYDKVSFYCPRLKAELMCLCTENLKEGMLVFFTTDDFAVDALTHVETEISEYVSKEKKPYEPSLMEICLAFYDDNWYRAVVTEIQDDKYLVFYVDYGNSKSVTAADIRKMPGELIKAPCLALFCQLSLKGLQITSQGIPDPQFKQLNELLKEETCYEVNLTPKTDGTIIKYLAEIPAISKQLEYEYDGLM